MKLFKNLILPLGVLLLIHSPSFALGEKPNSEDLIGKIICRDAMDPSDTTSFRFSLLKKGTISGNGNFSGASANFDLASGTWKLTGSYIEVTLVFNGKTYGPEGIKSSTRRLGLKIPSADLLADNAECFVYGNALKWK